ncbi:hypothetical protein SAY87_004691 [Trapa incisa]|uniref:Uncharacterized protein n=1 Tax=Trapa incisa TaxID=236973 RepID=A0AAN7JPC1_9MYRT|nr:hypothetical protein SAY87_004691 [Trapa incisa]
MPFMICKSLDVSRLPQIIKTLLTSSSLATKKKPVDHISGNETFEKLGAIVTLANLPIYLTTVFNLKSITAANILSIFNGTTNFSTLLGLKDLYPGESHMKPNEKCDAGDSCCFQKGPTGATLALTPYLYSRQVYKF